MSNSPLSPAASPPTPSLLTLPFEIRSVIYFELLDSPLRLRAPCPLSRAALRKQIPLLSLLQTCRQFRDEVTPVLYRSVNFGWLANMTKALSHPARKDLYSRNVLEATSQYDIGLIVDCLSATRCLNRLQRLTLLAEVSALRQEERYISAIFKSLRLYRDDLSSVDTLLPFQVEFRLSVIDFEAKMQNGLSLSAPMQSDRVEHSAGMVCGTFDFTKTCADLYRPRSTLSIHRTKYTARPIPKY